MIQSNLNFWYWTARYGDWRSWRSYYIWIPQRSRKIEDVKRFDILFVIFQGPFGFETGAGLFSIYVSIFSGKVWNLSTKKSLNARKATDSIPVARYHRISALRPLRAFCSPVTKVRFWKSLGWLLCMHVICWSKILCGHFSKSLENFIWAKRDTGYICWGSLVLWECGFLTVLPVLNGLSGTNAQAWSLDGTRQSSPQIIFDDNCL